MRLPGLIDMPRMPVHVAFAVASRRSPLGTATVGGWCTLLLLAVGSLSATRLWAADREAPRAATELSVIPAEIRLDRPEATQQILVSTKATGGRSIDLTRSVSYRSGDDTIATVDALGLVQPLKDGATTVTISQGGVTKQIPVEVRGVDSPEPISFPRDVIPVLTKTRCNTGGCHGKAEGQNGFKLSVFGFDPRADHEQIVQASHGRRTFVPSPDESLFLRKGTAREPHGGGQRMDLSSLRYRRLKRWMSEGAKYVVDNQPQVVRIEVEPREQILLARGEQQLLVWAVDEAGVRRCVTTEAEYESNAGTIAGVDGRGFVQASEIPGEAAMLVRYLGHVTVSRITIPRPDVTFKRPPELNVIDKHAWNKLERLGIEPSGLCDDATYLRRAHLDVIGTLPTVAEAKAFLADPRADKRAKLVDALLERPEYADYWTMRFSDLLRVDQTKITPAGAVGFTRWLRKQFATNRPYDAMVRDIVTAKGHVRGESPAAYYKALDTPEVQARAVSQVFLGIRIECAQCHHHPSDRWGQDDYFAMAGLFSGVTRKKLADGTESIVPGLAKDLKHPRTGELVPARPLGGTGAEFGPYDDRRVYLANWMTADDNPYFSTMIVNRLWSHYFGRGLVEQIDDIRDTNPATNEPLLAALSQYMKMTAKYDLKAFTRLLLGSRLYQLASDTNTSNASDDQNFSHALHKPLPAEVLLDAICQATEVPESFPGWPVGYRAIQIWDSKLDSYFFRIFGRPIRISVCECERGNEPSIAQALHLMNSPEIGEKIRSREGVAARLARSPHTPSEIIDTLYLATVSRTPTEDERKVLLELYTTSENRRAATEDVLWTLLNSKEFLYTK